MRARFLTNEVLRDSIYFEIQIPVETLRTNLSSRETINRKTSYKKSDKKRIKIKKVIMYEYGVSLYV